ncbi:MAG: hypothetical protein ABL986_05500 [Vicinamibacterales bacterium]
MRSPFAQWSLGVAVAYFLLHLPFLAASPEDIDSINFALGLHQFDILLHQPHPPGYPVYIALGRASLWLLSALTSLSAVRADTLALALWSAVGGAVAVCGAARLFAAVERRFGDGRHTPLWPVVLLAVTPLFWMSGLRPMSDMPGLAAVLWSQALLIEGIEDRRPLVAGAALAWLTAGIRIQTLALTTPALLLAVVMQRQSGVWWLVSRVGGASAVGALAWAVPLFAVSGGLSAYLAALNTQAGEDFAFVDMLWNNPTPRRFAFSLYETFVLPWHSVALAIVVGVAAGIGAVMAAVKTPRAALVILYLFVPYIVYHLIFQETLTVRYALPVVPLVAWFAMRAADVARPAAWLGVPVVGAALAVSISGGASYARQAHPAYRALAEATARAATDAPAKVYGHFSLRRALQHGGTSLPFVEPRRQYEWMGPVQYWLEGGDRPVWFFGEAKRTDLALIDPVSRRDVVRYDWTVEHRGELSGTRPTNVEWYRLSQPGWFAGEGWSLTPEAGGMTRADRKGLDQRPIDAWVRRRAEAVDVMVGGQHLGPPGDPAAELRLLLDGRPIDSWTVAAPGDTFLRFVSLPAGSLGGPGQYATLRIENAVAANGRRPEVAIRQFDLQAASGVVYGFGEGWHEAEYAPATGARWRWTSERSVLRIRGTAQALTLTLRGESPLRYFDSAPTIRITSQGRVLRELRPTDDFEVVVEVPVDVWRDGEAMVAIESDKVYLPGQAEGTADSRHLGLRVFDAHLDTRLP